MKRTLQVLRGFFRFFLAFLLEEALTRVPLLRRLRGKRWRPRNPQRLRQYCVDMGGAFVKFGQFFSMRSDILPPAYCRALSTLFDRVPPFPAVEARRIVEQELGAPVDELFESFDDRAVGAASFAQGHVVTLKGENAGKQAIVKVARPGAEEAIATDTRLLVLLGWLVDISSVLGRIKLVPIFRDFARWTKREVYYVQEAKNADHLEEMTEWNVRQRIPWIYWEHTTNRVLTLEYLDGLPLSRIIERVRAGDPTLDEELERMSCSRLVLARNLFQSFLLQAFVGAVFHADPHPGNLVALPEDTIGFLDFGLLGRLNEESRREQALLMDAVVQENLERLFVAVLDLLDAPRGLAVTEVYDDFAEETDEWLDACDNPGATMDEKTITHLVQASMGIARQVGLVMPMQTMLYFKAVLTVDGVILRIAPEFDYKKELRRAMRLIRMRELDKLYGPGAVIDRALSLQLLANYLPDFLVQRLQDFEQGKKMIYRKLNLIPVIIGNLLRALAWLTALGGVGVLVAWLAAGRYEGLGDFVLWPMGYAAEAQEAAEVGEPSAEAPVGAAATAAPTVVTAAPSVAASASPGQHPGEAVAAAGQAVEAAGKAVEAAGQAVEEIEAGQGAGGNGEPADPQAARATKAATKAVAAAGEAVRAAGKAVEAAGKAVESTPQAPAAGEPAKAQVKKPARPAKVLTVRDVVDAVLPVVYIIPIVFLLLIWASRSALARTYKKVQKDE